MMCWFCTWGWPLAIKEIYLRYRNVVGVTALHYGPAHIVWDDENFYRESIEFCLKECARREDYDLTMVELDAVKQSLLELRELPDRILCPRPDFDPCEDAPEDFPPPPDLEMESR